MRNMVHFGAAGKKMGLKNAMLFEFLLKNATLFDSHFGISIFRPFVDDIEVGGESTNSKLQISNLEITSFF